MQDPWPGRGRTAEDAHRVTSLNHVLDGHTCNAALHGRDPRPFGPMLYYGQVGPKKSELAPCEVG